MSRRALLAATSLSLAVACAAERVDRRPAYAEFAASTFEDAWQRSVKALESQGYQLEMQDRARGILVTKERELQAPCGAETCLSRERAYLRLTSAGRAIANIQREHWDASARRWNASSDRAAIVAVEKAELELLQEAVGGKPVLRRSGRDEPCTGDEECASGLVCSARRCAKATPRSP